MITQEACILLMEFRQEYLQDKIIIVPYVFLSQLQVVLYMKIWTMLMIFGKVPPNLERSI